jgi:hypothetical protein
MTGAAAGMGLDADDCVKRSSGTRGRPPLHKLPGREILRRFAPQEDDMGEAGPARHLHTIAPDATHQQIVILTEGKDLETWMPALSLTAAVARMPGRQTWKVSVSRDLPDFLPSSHTPRP